MAYNYLFDLYDKIDQHLKEANEELKDDKKSKEDLQFHNGRIDILVDFRDYLSENMDSKLPKRLRKKLKGATDER